MRKKSSVILKILNRSLILNVLLVIAVGWLAIGRLNDMVTHHYYGEYAGFVLHDAAAQIQAGHSDLVVQVLGGLPQPPTYGDLGAAADKLEKKDPEPSAVPKS